MLTMYKDFKFDAAHRLCNDDLDINTQQEAFGRCYNIHGHTYKLRVGVTGGIDSDTGMIANFVELKNLVNRHVINQVDHKYLNDVKMFIGKVVTAEVMVCEFWDILKQALRYYNVVLTEICLWETETSFVRKVEYELVKD